MFNVHAIWDPLRVCIVGRGYPPEFFSWIENPRARSAMEKVAEQSEEDFQLIVKKLQQFDVEVLRPNIQTHVFNNTYYSVPPLLPRDRLGMIGTTFYERESFAISDFYRKIKDPSWPNCESMDEFFNLPMYIQQECTEVHQLNHWLDYHNSYNDIISCIKAQGNTVRSHVRDDLDLCNSAQLRILGQDLISGNWTEDLNPAWQTFSPQDHQQFLDQEFSQTQNHIFNTQGHADSSFCPVAPGLILTRDNLDFDKIFSGWEILHIPNTDALRVERDPDYHRINAKWRIPGFDQDSEVIDIIENKLKTWIGNSGETVFDIGVLHIDQKNVMTFGNHEPTLNRLEKSGITVHQMQYRHRWFWDGGIHCVTCDIHRQGSMRKILP